MAVESRLTEHHFLIAFERSLKSRIWRVVVESMVIWLRENVPETFLQEEILMKGCKKAGWRNPANNGKKWAVPINRE
ncbi:hypothetical protein ACFFJN_11645 [Erwinia mallotivora]|uniref:hypothetical protein n=1 Tax=Erwinia mallotivora TaxID=69222 RepID=UPI0035EA1466